MSSLQYPFPDAPPADGTLEVAAGVRWISMPLPFQLDHINLWWIADTIIDTGIGDEATRAPGKNSSWRASHAGHPHALPPRSRRQRSLALRAELVPEFPLSYRRIIEGDRVAVGGHAWRAFV